MTSLIFALSFITDFTQPFRPFELGCKAYKEKEDHTYFALVSNLVKLKLQKEYFDLAISFWKTSSLILLQCVSCLKTMIQKQSLFLEKIEDRIGTSNTYLNLEKKT